MRFPLFTHSLTRTLAVSSQSHASAQADNSPGTTCQQSLKVPAPSTYCGYTGTLTKPTASTKQSGVTLTQCSNACFDDSTCQSFGFLNSQCSLYTKTLSAMGYKRSNAAANPVYYNMACYVQSCPNLLAADGDFEERNGWTYYDTTSQAQGLQAKTGKGYDSPTGGVFTLTNDAASYDSLYLKATQNVNITSGQRYIFSVDYKPSLQGCFTYFSDSGGINRYLILGSSTTANVTGESVQIGKWSQHSSTFVVADQILGEDTSITFAFPFSFSTVCPSVAGLANPPKQAVAFDNFIIQPAPIAPYDSSSPTTGPNLIAHDPGFAQGSLSKSYDVYTASGVKVATKAPGYNGTGKALTVTVSIPNGSPLADAILSQPIAAVKGGKAYSTSFVYKASATDGSTDGYNCFIQTLQMQQLNATQFTQVTDYDDYPYYASSSYAQIINQTDWTVISGIFAPEKDGGNFLFAAACNSGPPVAITIDNLEMYEITY